MRVCICLAFVSFLAVNAYPGGFDFVPRRAPFVRRIPIRYHTVPRSFSMGPRLPIGKRSFAPMAMGRVPFRRLPYIDLSSYFPSYPMGLNGDLQIRKRANPFSGFVVRRGPLQRIPIVKMQPYMSTESLFRYPMALSQNMIPIKRDQLPDEEEEQEIGYNQEEEEPSAQYVYDNWYR